MHQCRVQFLTYHRLKWQQLHPCLLHVVSLGQCLWTNILLCCSSVPPITFLSDYQVTALRLLKATSLRTKLVWLLCLLLWWSNYSTLQWTKWNMRAAHSWEAWKQYADGGDTAPRRRQNKIKSLEKHLAIVIPWLCYVTDVCQRMSCTIVSTYRDVFLTAKAVGL